MQNCTASQHHDSTHNDPEYALAARRVARKLEFYGHLMIYILINSFLIWINLSTTPQHLWFIWPVLGWGIGLFCHGVKTFFLGSNTGLHQRMMARELQRLQGHE
ncbi:2TM domain-containing protein [Massilia sp. W12]|uniref:2TM domain-containing protein n=1 Tax=Massilia sp. W12 TaxID=3126507 RepID=UPI0030CF9316